MKQFVRIWKPAWNLLFWILFFASLAFFMDILKNKDVSRLYFIPSLGALLIANRVYLVKGSIKRLFYFLTLLSLFSILVTLIHTTNSQNFPKSLSFIDLYPLMLSYFHVSAIFTASVTPQIYNLFVETLNLKISKAFTHLLIQHLLNLVIFYPFVALHIKRLRDANLSYWLTLITLIPGINILFEIFLCLKGPTKRTKQVKHKTNKVRTTRKGLKHKTSKRLS